jgi:transcriptional regulator with XRE-family HTH domain
MVNQNIKSIREIRNYTQEYLASKLEISQGGYSKIEQGTVDVNCKMLFKIAEILQVEPSQILEFDKSKLLKSALDTENQHKKMLVVLDKIANSLNSINLLLTQNVNYEKVSNTRSF